MPSGHIYHEDLDGYDPRQIWFDHCPECERRGADPAGNLGHLDSLKFVAAWRRAALTGDNSETAVAQLGPVSNAEGGLLEMLYQVEVALEAHCNVPVGMVPKLARPGPDGRVPQPAPPLPGAPTPGNPIRLPAGTNPIEALQQMAREGKLPEGVQLPPELSLAETPEGGPVRIRQGCNAAAPLVANGGAFVGCQLDTGDGHKDHSVTIRWPRGN
jgi:hypothetical protein